MCDNSRVGIVKADNHDRHLRDYYYLISLWIKRIKAVTNLPLSYLETDSHKRRLTHIHVWHKHTDTDTHTYNHTYTLLDKKCCVEVLLWRWATPCHLSKPYRMCVSIVLCDGCFLSLGVVWSCQSGVFGGVSVFMNLFWILWSSLLDMCCNLLWF